MARSTNGSLGMMNPSLDFAALREAFNSHRRIRIAEALPPEVAEDIRRELANLRYSVFCATSKGVAVLEHDEIARWPQSRKDELRDFLMEGAAGGEGFAYNGFRITEAMERLSPATALGRLARDLESPAMLEMIRTITGPSDIDSAFAQATQFLPGHYLTRHLDDPAGERRRFAFVWGFTPVWRPDWGGLLQFFTPDLEPSQSLSPGFNTLDLFDVSHWHSVTYVAPFAQAPRLAISGWFTKR
jgi:Rps23 Pro-64 3,4-dihydroxylase Tpa1-like proline 4-hydroxylase